MFKYSVLSFLILAGAQAAQAECVQLEGSRLDGLAYCAKVVVLNDHSVRLEEPYLYWSYISGSNSAGLALHHKRQLCRIFSSLQPDNSGKSLRYLRGSVVKGYSRERAVDGNQQGEIASPGESFTVIYSVDCEIH